MNLSLIDLADNDSRTSDSPSLGTRTPTPSATNSYGPPTPNATPSSFFPLETPRYGSSQGDPPRYGSSSGETPRYGSATPDLHAALNNIPKSYSSQLSQYAQYSTLPQYQTPPGLNFPLPASASYPQHKDIKDLKDRRDREREAASSYAALGPGSLSNPYSQTVPTGSALSQSQMPVSGSATSSSPSSLHQMSKYSQLLAVIEEIGKDIRPTYAGSKSSAERLKRGIIHARILVREALMEAERSARQ